MLGRIGVELFHGKDVYLLLYTLLLRYFFWFPYFDTVHANSSHGVTWYFLPKVLWSIHGINFDVLQGEYWQHIFVELKFGPFFASSIMINHCHIANVATWPTRKHNLISV